MMKLLESKGADYTLTSILGFTPVHSAVDSDSVLSLAYLYYQKKVNFEAKTISDLTPFLFSVSLK